MPEFTPELVAAFRAGAQAGDPEAMCNLAAFLYLQGRLKDSILWAQRAWRAGDLNAGFNLGTWHLEAGDTHLADLVWTQAAQRGDADSMLCVARLALQRGDRRAAGRWLEPLLAQSQPYPITAMGVAYRDHGDVETAMRAFERAIALGDGYAMRYAARIHQAKGDHKTARRLLRSAAGATHFGLGRFDS
jgi:TPR repeat protein